MLPITKKNTFSGMMILIVIALSATLVGCSEAINQSSAVNPAIDKPAVDPEQHQTATSEATPPASSTPLEERFDPASGQMKRETRALWSTVASSEKPISKRDIDAMMSIVDQAHLNVILLRIYYHGLIYFEPSHTRFPDSNERLPNQSKLVEGGYRDALSYLLAIRDERRADADPTNDFEVQAWFNVIQGGEKGDGWPEPDETQPGALNAFFPEFKLKYGVAYLEEDERFTRHSTSVVHQPKFRAYMVNLIAGLVEDYNVDGVHLDLIRTDGLCFNTEFLDYPGTAYDYPGCQEDYKAWTRETYGREYTLWEDTDGLKTIQDEGSGRVAAWQARAVGMLVKSIHDEVKAVRPDVIISVASVRNDPSPEVMKQEVNGQVAWEWLDKGWIDAIFVTAYSPDTQGIIDYILEPFRAAVQNESYRSKVFPGLLTYSLDTREEWSYLVAEQVNAVMYGQWAGRPLDPPARGVGLFRTGYFGQGAIDALAEGPFKQPALPFWGESESTTESTQSQ